MISQLRLYLQLNDLLSKRSFRTTSGVNPNCCSIEVVDCIIWLGGVVHSAGDMGLVSWFFASAAGSDVYSAGVDSIFIIYVAI